MVSLCLPSLFDLCGIRVAYLMWARHDVTKRCSKEVLFEELVDIVLANVQNSPLTEQAKSCLLKHLKPAGKHLLSLMSLWLSKAQPEGSQKWLTGEILFDCLVLNADGLINQRKTAEKLLGSKLLNDVFAFRLACINFLEREVLKLWPLVKLYFLNKIMLESEQPDPTQLAGSRNVMKWTLPN
ncbi:hypothetical protein AVEN_261964-1 [Araneus ventricosus]|uniref:Uncharacterized protein n=1 Tax=Araneus ventricosus TaxID=182803 RepID=A0A4Y2EQU8_ARAVE|nr:hypothetical protein AVEN_261964-1 [Araneus ventricosus]